jgi:predicted RNase H-like HicB family nuclease
MATVEIELESMAESPEIKEDWRAQKAYRCHICFIPEEDSSYSVIVLNLPGCGSCGQTKEEALKNVREAISGVIESYIVAGEEIPWIDRYAIPKDTKNNEDAKSLWILVNA